MSDTGDTDDIDWDKMQADADDMIQGFKDLSDRLKGIAAQYGIELPETPEQKPAKNKREDAEKPFLKCKQHKECRKLRGKKEDIFGIVQCPWCGYSVGTSNIGMWCASCYTKYEFIGDFMHFGKHLPKTMAEALCIALAKSGGAKFGSI